MTDDCLWGTFTYYYVLACTLDFCVSSITLSWGYERMVISTSVVDNRFGSGETPETYEVLLTV